MNNQSENKICQNCKHDFTIEPEDFKFYEKIKVPPPTFCPECRTQRRSAIKNNMALYNRKCDLCDKAIISLFSLDSPYTVYCNKCWWSDNWDPKSYGVEYDFSKPFFLQHRELLQRVPQVAMVNDDDIASVNCKYTSDWWFSKNCYMCFVGWHVENSMYSYFILAGKDIVDCLIIRSKSESLYECFLVSGCYNVKYSSVDKSCINSQFIFDCIDCQDCLMCANLRGKRYNYKNKQYTKEEYEKILESYRLDTYSGVQKAQEEYDTFILKYPRRFALAFRTVNCLGDIISDSKNVKYAFAAKNTENVRYSEFIVDANSGVKDCYDLTTTGGTSQSYEGVVVDHSEMNFFGFFTVKSQDVKYTQHCHNCKYTFGSIGLRNANYCILNKQYSKKEYEDLLDRIIKQMDDMPYIDKAGNIYKYGEYYPIELSSFGYNETSALDQFPMTKEAAKKRGYKWQDNIQRTIGKGTLSSGKIPDSIEETADSITSEVLTCIECERNYKIVPNELLFYRKMKIPIPHKCFFCRHEARMKRKNPFKLWHRKCMKKGCEIEFE